MVAVTVHQKYPAHLAAGLLGCHGQVLQLALAAAVGAQQANARGPAPGGFFL